MKADKIYVGIQDLGSGYATDVSLTPKEGYSEYIRKDALLEWLIEQRDNAASLDDQFVSNAIGEYEAYQETIDKLNEM